MLELTPDELLTTTRAVRKRLDLQRPVARQLVAECLDVAFQAPNGSNQQRWNWIAVDDPTTRREVARLYREGMQHQRDHPPPHHAAIDYTGPAMQRMGSSVAHLAEHMHEVPVLLIPTLGGRMEGASIFSQASLWGSILPAVWNFMLALRARGLGSAWTTVHLHREKEMASLLGIPYDEVTQAGLFPVAHTLGTDFRPGPRDEAARSLHWNHW